VIVPPRAYAPDLLFAAGEVREGAALVVEGGRVSSVGAAPPGAEQVRLSGAAVLPGLVSAHGHAFQRALRGRPERRAAGGSDFWSWREAMYAVASRVGPDELESIARLAFLELARSGATAAGEFHYLHHDPAGRPYADRDELARRVIGAAREVGLRVTLLRAAYARAGHRRPAEGAQRRFVEASPDEAASAVERLAASHRGDPLVRFGLAPHSARACPAEWIAALAREAERRALPLHVHVSEQPAEVEAVRAEHGVSPVALLARCGALGPRTTAVHAIHVDAEDVEALGAARACVCACPLTERDLGDGVVPADRLLAAGARMALGVDSFGEVDLLAEARALEGHLRLVRLERGVLASRAAAATAAPAATSSAIPAPTHAPSPALFERLYGFASAGGMASLGWGGGALAPGEPADFVVISLDDPSIAGAGADDLVPAVVSSMARTAVRDVYVGGEPVVRDGRAVRVEESRAVARAVAALHRLRA
jgi:formimidoylglutamate deiminase